MFKKKSKRMRAIYKKIDIKKKYFIEDALKILKNVSSTKIDETIEVAFKLNSKNKKAINIKGSIILPNSFNIGKKILVFASGEKIEEAKKAKADYISDFKIIEKIKKGWSDFKIVITTPSMIKEVSKIGRFLGSKGLMPNLKTNTITEDIFNIVTEFKNKRVIYNEDKYFNINILFGKLSLDIKKNLENYNILYKTILNNELILTNDKYIEKIVITSTFGPGLVINNN